MGHLQPKLERAMTNHKPTTAEQRERWRRCHASRAHHIDGHPWCYYCGVEAPCVVIRLLDDLKAAEQAARDADFERDVAQGEAKALWDAVKEQQERAETLERDLAAARERMEHEEILHREAMQLYLEMSEERDTLKQGLTAAQNRMRDQDKLLDESEAALARCGASLDEMVEERDTLKKRLDTVAGIERKAASVLCDYYTGLSGIVRDRSSTHAVDHALVFGHWAEKRIEELERALRETADYLQHVGGISAPSFREKLLGVLSPERLDAEEG